MLRTRKKRVDQKALLDSGATECFIHPRMINHLALKTRKLQVPRSVRNVNGTSNKAGKITDAVDLITNHRGTKTTHVFFIADIGPDNFILGYPFLEACAPIINWSDATLANTTTLSTLDTDRWSPPKKGTPRQKRGIPLWVRSLPGWEAGDEVWQHFTIRKNTIAQQLAIDANEKKGERPWQELVPAQYHRHAKVFHEKDSEKFPD